MVAGAGIGFAEQADHFIGKKLAVQDQDGIALPLLLAKELLKLTQDIGDVGPQALAPVAHARIRDGQESHENVRAADAVPVRLAGLAQRFADRHQSGLGEQFQAQLTVWLENIIQRFIRVGHGGRPWGTGKNAVGAKSISVAAPDDKYGSASDGRGFVCYT